MCKFLANGVFRNLSTYIILFIFLYVFIVCHSENKCSHVLIHWAVYILFGNAQRSNSLDSFVMPKRRVHERAPRTAETAEEKEQETEQVKDSVIGHSVLSTEAGLMHRETTGCKGATAWVTQLIHKGTTGYSSWQQMRKQEHMQRSAEDPELK